MRYITKGLSYGLRLRVYICCFVSLSQGLLEYLWILNGFGLDSAFGLDRIYPSMKYNEGELIIIYSLTITITQYSFPLRNSKPSAPEDGLDMYIGDI